MLLLLPSLPIHNLNTHSLVNKKRFHIYFLVAFALLIRLAYLWVGAEIFPARPNIFLDSDTWLWFTSLKNLFETGVYTYDPGNAHGFFARTPGYAFFMAIFYLIFDGNPEFIFPAMGYAQLFLDVLATWMFYQVAYRLFGKHFIALAIAFVYACYPFVIVWNPIAYSESLSIFLLISIFFVYLSDFAKPKWFWVGILAGFATLVRPQMALFIPLFGLLLLFENRTQLRRLLRLSVFFTLGVLLTYGSWPIRNYLNYQKLVLTQDLRGLNNWGEDVINFMVLMHAVKENWEPQFSQILKRKKVTTPALLQKDTADARLFQKTAALAQTCAYGFSQWQSKGYAGKPLKQAGCTPKVAENFAHLKAEVVRKYPLHYYLLVPLKNLKKALFKHNASNSEPHSLLIKILFFYRTLLIFIGLVGSFFWLNNRNAPFRSLSLLILVYVIGWYLLLCGGMATQMRNMEMRYLLPADVLLIFPAGYFLERFLTFFKLLRNTTNRY